MSIESINQKLLDRYDWVVLGDNPGALLTGCVAAHQGLQVLFLPLFPSVTSQLTRSGQCVDPETNMIMGLGVTAGYPGLLGETLAGLGVLVRGLKNIVSDESTALQVITPDLRVQFPIDDQMAALEWERELGAEFSRRLPYSRWVEKVTPSVFNFWKSFSDQIYSSLRGDPAPPDGKRKSVSHQDSLQEMLGQLGRTHRIPSRSQFEREDMGSRLRCRETLQGLAAGLSHIQSDQLDLMQLIHLTALDKSSSVFLGGMSAYRDFLLSLAKRLGATLARDLHCKRIFVESGRLVGVQIAQQGKMIGSESGILGCGLRHSKDYLYDSSEGVKQHAFSTPTPSGWKFTMALTVHAEAIPPGLGRRSVWSEEGSPAVEIEIGEPSEFHLESMGNRFIFVRTVMPFTQESLKIEYQRRVSARLFKLLTEIIPFLEYHLVKLFPDFREAYENEGDEFSEIYGFVTPEIIPENLLVYSGKGLGSETGVQGLYLASSESYPELGSFGAFISGMEAIQRVIQEKKRDKSLTPELNDSHKQIRNKKELEGDRSLR